jgi:hypothetical protein
MSLRSLSFRFAALGVALLMASSTLAQQRNFGNPAMGNPAMQRPQVIKKIGTFVISAQNQFQMSTNTNDVAVITVGPETEVTVTGTAEQDYLKAGVTVEFVAEVDKTHTVKDKIIHLFVISPTADRPIGLLPPESATTVKKDSKEKGAGAGGDRAKPLGADPGIAGDAPAKPRKPHAKADSDAQGGDNMFSDKPAKGKKTTPQFPGNFTVRGTIKMCKNGTITVSAGRGPTVKATLADDVTIDVDMNDFHAAQRDDKVTVNGLTTPANPNMVLAKSVEIELVKPLSGAKKHATRSIKTPAASATKTKKGATDPADPLSGGK